LSDSKPQVRLFTDGSCLGNPGPGGWAYILEHPATGRVCEVSGGERRTTNNRMELMAVIRGLRALSRSCRVELSGDSEYVLLGLRDWMPKWTAKGWRRGSKPPKNVELWQALDEELQRHEVTIRWVRGHTGHPENERCDELARAQAARFRDDPAVEEILGREADPDLFS